jgi:hypothetical protein
MNIWKDVRSREVGPGEVGEGRTMVWCGTNECPKYNEPNYSMAKASYLDRKRDFIRRMEYGAKALERNADDHTAKKPISTLMHGLAIFSTTVPALMEGKSSLESVRSVRQWRRIREHQTMT